MKILYFSNKPIGNNVITSYNGGGWIDSVISEIRHKEGFKVAVAYFGDSNKKNELNGLTYYQIKQTKHSLFFKIIYKLKLFISNSEKTEKKKWPYYERILMNVVNDYKPDLIHVFGSEQQFGLVAGVTKIPVILHIQGLINPIYNSYLPPFFSWPNFLTIKGKTSLILMSDRIKWKMLATMEKEIFRRVKYVIGRTDFDRRVAYCLNNEIQYFYGAEILRPSFYLSNCRNLPDKCVIVSTISFPLYKGFDNILKTAYVLKNHLHINFIWYVFGNCNVKYVEHTLDLHATDLNVILKGVAGEQEIKDLLINCTCYVQPSHIDNSPNGLCEAQMLGVPSIATNVGGVCSIINHGVTGFLVPDNDPYQMASLIKYLYDNKEANLSIGNKSKEAALVRHNKKNIIESLINIYKSLK